MKKINNLKIRFVKKRNSKQKFLFHSAYVHLIFYILSRLMLSYNYFKINESNPKRFIKF